MKRQADAVIGDAVLRKIVGADFFGAVAGFDLTAAFDGERRLAFLLFLFVEARAENAHGFGPILDLRFFILLGNDESAGNVRDAHGGISGVDGLAAGAGGAKSVDAQIFGFDLDVDFVSFGENRDGGGGSVDAALRFRRGNALDAVNTAFVLQFGIDFVALNRRDNFFEPAE